MGFVQEATPVVDNTLQTSKQIALSGVVAGNMLLFAVATFNEAGVSGGALADSSGDAWTLVKTYGISTAGQLHVWRRDNARAGTHTLTFTPDDNAQMTLVMTEWSGVIPGASLDANPAGATGTGTTATSSDTGVLSRADELVISFGTHDSGNIALTNGNIIGAASTKLQGFENGSIGMPIITEYRIVSATTAGTAVWTAASSVTNWRITIHSFRLAPTIAYRATGTTSKVASGNMTPGLPAGHLQNDILRLTTNQQDNVACAIAGWTLITAVNNGANNRKEIWAKRDTGFEVAPTVTHTAGGVSNAVIDAWSGVDPNLTIGIGAGAIFRDVRAGKGSDISTFTAPALFGVVAGDMLIFDGGFTVNDTSGATTNNWGTVTGFAERVDDCSGLGGAWASSFGIDSLLAAGAAGAITSAVGWSGLTTPAVTWTWIAFQLALSSQVLPPPVPVPGIAIRGTPSTFAGSGTSTNLTKPAGVAIGDFLLVGVASFGNISTPGTHNVPSGFTLLGSGLSGPPTQHNVRKSWYWRIATGGEGATLSVSHNNENGDGFIDADYIAFSGVKASSPFNRAAQVTFGISASATTADLGATTEDRCWHVVAFCSWASLSGAMAGYTEDIDYASSNEEAWHKQITPAGATGAQTQTQGGADGFVAMAVALNPFVAPVLSATDVDLLLQNGDGALYEFGGEILLETSRTRDIYTEGWTARLVREDGGLIQDEQAPDATLFLEGTVGVDHLLREDGGFISGDSAANERLNLQDWTGRVQMENTDAIMDESFVSEAIGAIIVALTGTLTSAGALVKSTVRLLAGTTSPSGAVVKTTTKPGLAGTMTSAGALLKTGIKQLGGTTTSAGALTTLKVKIVALTATLTSSGAIVKSTIRTTLAGTMTSAGALVKTVIKPLAGTMTSAGALVKTTVKQLGGTLTSSGLLVVLKVKIVTLAGTLTSSGALLKFTTRLLAGTTSPSGTLTRTTTKQTAGTLTSTGDIRRGVTRLLAGTMTSSGAVATLKVKIVLLAGTLTSAGALVKTGIRQLGGTMTSSGAIRRATTRTLGGTLNPTGAIVKTTKRLLAGVIGFIGTLALPGFGRPGRARVTDDAAMRAVVEDAAAHAVVTDTPAMMAVVVDDGAIARVVDDSAGRAVLRDDVED